MRLSQRLAKLFRFTPPDSGAANDSQPWMGTAPDIDSRIAEWTELIEGGVPPALPDDPATTAMPNEH